MMMLGIVFMTYGYATQPTISVPPLPSTIQEKPPILAANKTCDINHDGIVDGVDLYILERNYGKLEATDPNWNVYQTFINPATGKVDGWYRDLDCDLNGDGFIGYSDVLILQNYYHAQLSMFNYTTSYGQEFMSGIVLFAMGAALIGYSLLQQRRR